ncbi:MAG: hypothetical protein WKF71_20700 [Pyrinomonadaceae bacterium]
MIAAEYWAAANSTADRIFKLTLLSHSGKNYWIEGYTNLAGRQDRLSSSRFGRPPDRRGAFADTNSKLFQARRVCSRDNHARDPTVNAARRAAFWLRRAKRSPKCKTVCCPSAQPSTACVIVRQ